MAKSFNDDLMEMYQGEVVGEVAFERLWQVYDDPQVRYKIATMLQLETETKARLRPALLALGMSPVEEPASRELGGQFADAVAGMSWQDAMGGVRDGVKPYLEKYQRAVENAPPEYKALAESMVEHEASLYDFCDAEATGDTGDALSRIISQLVFPVDPPRG